MNFSRDEMLQSYGMESDFPDKWSDSGATGAVMTTLAQTDSQAAAPDQQGSALLNQMLGQLSSDTKVSSDDKDPLGSTPSIIAVLQSRSILPSSSAERAKYMPSSVQFDPSLFLRDVHAEASMEDLQNGLHYLKESLAGTAQGLRQVIDTDYESYVASKRRLDNVMAQLKSLGMDGESEYGLKSLRERLDAASNSMVGYAQPLDMQADESRRFQNALKYIEANRQLFELPQSLEKHATANDHEKFLREYKSGIRRLNELGNTARSGHKGGDDAGHSDASRLANILRDRVEVIIEKYRSKLREQLLETNADEAYSLLLAKLVDLGVQANPALEWLDHNIKRFHDEIDDVFNRITATAERNANEAVEIGSRLELAYYLRQFDAEESVQDACEKLEMTEAADSEEIIAQWTEMVALFDSLRRSLGRACVFYREFVSLSQNPSASKWAMTPQQTDAVTQQSLDLVNLASQRLVECLSAPVSQSMGLPIASAYSSSNGNVPESLGIVPLNSNSLAVAKYLGRILDCVTNMLDDVSELMGPQNALSGGVSTAKELFVKGLCHCWSRDSLQFGKIQDWSLGSGSATLPRYFVLYHGIIIERLQFLLDSGHGVPVPQHMVALVNRIFPAALSLSVRSLESSLVDLSKSTANSAAAAQLESQLQPNSLSQDARLLMILDHLETLKEQSLEQVYMQYESVFRQSARTEDVRRQVIPDVETISGQLFDVYIRKKRSKLTQVVQQETQRLERRWREPGGEVTSISNYVYECLLILVEIHALFMESCPRLARRALLELYTHVLTCILGALRNVDSLSRFGTLQNVADLEFLRWAMSPLSETREACQRIFDAIKDASTDRDVWSGQDGPRGFVRTVLDEAVRHDQFAFASFKTLAQPTSIA